MRILFEGFKYEKELLKEIFENSSFHHQDGTILKVGYYYSYKMNELVYLLPKVFLKDDTSTIFKGKKVEEFATQNLNISLKHDPIYKWARLTSIYFYKSLVEFKKRNTDTTILNSSEAHNLNSNLGDKEYSYQELVLSFVNFYRKNKTQILFNHIEHISNQVKKTKWEKTIRKSLPILNSNNQPVYTIFRNKKKVINREEELITLYFSVLNNLNKEHNFNLHIDKSYSIIEGAKFQSLKNTGYSKLRRIKFKYFNDTLKKMYHLCEMYFKHSNVGSLKKTDEFISVSSYNLVFEDMIDKLLTDKTYEIAGENKKNNIDDLRKNDDGKIIDHLFIEKSLIDTTNIFAIGDSKYYKTTKSAGKESRFKQFTYAKNIIQQNLNLFHEKSKKVDGVRYRDSVTEGYDITPNFFIYGFINNIYDFDSNVPKPRDVAESFHWKHRLFDRDTLFVHQYELNFLFILKSYSESNSNKIEAFRESTKQIFRANILDYFKNSQFEVFEYHGTNHEAFVIKHFKTLNGKSIITSEGKLLIAKHKNDENDEIVNLVNGLNKFEWI
ncbi:hypothetical protein N9602_01495 [Saprospiraceae bacterium]|nr:hypothetical protein [Saprospiraceae bacterium]